ncbi:hypothetical protein ILYODFUR_008768 [Ilyodon furcidens]|uniref:Uncharacterized protein n=1 Tax=Ilyodon furcidens TaxID=33524 RepID=A0ABV0TH36_9TELE
MIHHVPPTLRRTLETHSENLLTEFTLSGGSHALGSRGSWCLSSSLRARGGVHPGHRRTTQDKQPCTHSCIPM